MISPPEDIPRRVLSLAVDAAAAFRVVVLNGPRQAGKSTLLRQMQATLGGTVLSLDDERLLAAAAADPAGFVLSDSPVLLIDEVQRGGDALIRAIKSRVDDPTNTTRFVLAGSTNFLTVPTLSESLAGRAVLLEVWPFSQGELDRAESTPLESWLADPTQIPMRHPTSRVSREEVFRRICAGGFPEASRLPEGRLRTAWFRSYVQTVTQRDITEISNIRAADELPRLLRYLAAKTSQELVKSQLAARTGMQRGTVTNYLPLLETVFLHRELPAWSRNPLGKVTKHPKVHLVDTGLAATLMGVQAAALTQPIAPARGQLVETFVYNEIVRQASWSEAEFSLSHWRDRAGAEVDLVVETAAGDVLAIETKAALDVSQPDFRSLARLRDKLGTQFLHGVVLYLGHETLSFGPRLTALPLASLWA